MIHRPNSYAVARMAGVSRSVVSLVIHGHADRYRISRTTQERVREAIRRTGYAPDLEIRNLFLSRRSGIPSTPPAVSVSPAPVAATAVFSVPVAEPVSSPALPPVAERPVPVVLPAPAPAPVEPASVPVAPADLPEAAEEPGAPSPGAS